MIRRIIIEPIPGEYRHFYDEHKLCFRIVSPKVQLKLPEIKVQELFPLRAMQQVYFEMWIDEDVIGVLRCTVGENMILAPDAISIFDNTGVEVYCNDKKLDGESIICSERK